jgi:hypothetical protein
MIGGLQQQQAAADGNPMGPQLRQSGQVGRQVGPGLGRRGPEGFRFNEPGHGVSGQQ